MNRATIGGRIRRVAGKVLRGLVAVLFFIAVILLVGALWLVSPRGLQWAVPRAESTLTETLGTEVRIEGLRLRWPLRVDMALLRVGEVDEPYLLVKTVQLRVSARALARREVRVRYLRGEQISYQGWPDRDVEEAPDPADREPFEWSGLPESIGPIRAIHVEEVRMDAIEFGDAAIRLSGSLRIDFESDRAATQWDIVWSGVTEDDGSGSVSGEIAVIVDMESSRSTPVPVVSAGIRCDELLLQDMLLRNLGVSLVSDGHDVAYALKGEGDRPEIWKARTEGLIQWQELNLAGVQMSELSLQYGDLLIGLLEPLVVRRHEDVWELEQMRMQIGEGTFVASGEVGQTLIDVSADIFDVPLSMFGFGGVSPAQGDFRGHFSVQGDPGDPEARLEFVFSDLLPANPEQWEGPPAEFRAEFVLGSGRLECGMQIKGPAGPPVDFQLAVPMVVSLLPFHVEWPPQGDITGRFHAETDLAMLAQLFVLDIHRVSGLLTVDLGLSGTVEEPVLTGHVAVEGGQYEHDLLGTRLRDIDLAFSGERNQLRLDHFSASDGRGGTVHVSGGIALQTQENYPFEGHLDLHTFRLMHNDTMTLTGDGRISWQGNRLASSVNGTMQIGPAEFAIPERLPAAMIDLGVIELDGDTPPPTVAEAPGVPHDMGLDVNVIIPDRFFVRGRGLDSEWGGQLRIRGSATEPVVTGSLSIIRGRFVFFGKRLGLTRGMITFDGSVPPQPGLDIVAEARTRQMTAIMRLAGAVDAPEIILESIPALPQDEILAQLLFGRDSDRITPWQAITIAQAVNQLRGSSSAFDVMGETRRFLRVDQIELRDDDEDGEMTVTVGKYISDRIYVELERGGGESTRAAVEIELTPTLRLTSEVGTEAQAGIGLSWQWDF